MAPPFLKTGIVDYEDISSQIDGVRTVFRVAKGSYIQGSLRVVFCGIQQNDQEFYLQSQPGMGEFSTTEIPLVGDRIIVSYRYGIRTTTYGA